jgi:hypothetical protein
LLAGGYDEPAAKKLKTEGREEAQPGGGGPGPGQPAGDYDVAAAAAVIAAAAGGGGALSMEHALASGGLTAEQLAALQSMPMVTPEMLAAAMQPGADGSLQLPALGEVPQFLDPSVLGMAGMDVLQNLPPEQLQAFLANSAGLQQYFLPGGYPLPGGGPGGDGAGESGPTTYKNWWDEKDEQELMRMSADREYRLDKLGCEDMDWAKLEIYFNRSQNALRKKFWMLSKGRSSGSGGGGSGSGSGGLPPDAAHLAELQGMDAAALNAAAAAHAAHMVAASAAPLQTVGAPSSHPRQRAERKNWSEEETRDMERVVTDLAFRAAEGLQDAGADEVAWDRLAARFSCSLQTAKRKFRHLQEQAAAGGGVIPEKGKRQHFRKSVPYRWMIVSALSKIAGFEATAPQIFENIEADPELRSQLDMRIMPGTKHVPRWKIQVRKVLSADHIFINTGVKQKHETIWRLDPVALQEANADRQRQRAGVPPISLSPGDALPAAPALNGAGGELSAMQLQLNDQAMALLHQQQMQQLLSLQQHQLQLTDPNGAMLGGLEGGGMDPAMAAAMAASAAAAGMGQEGGHHGEGGHDEAQAAQAQHDHDLLEHHQAMMMAGHLHHQHHQHMSEAQNQQLIADHEQQIAAQQAAEVAAWQHAAAAGGGLHPHQQQQQHHMDGAQQHGHG